MKNIFQQFFCIALIFFSVWWGLSKINYIKYFHLQALSEKTERQIGDLMIKQIKQDTKEIEDDSITGVFDELNLAIYTKNHLCDTDIKIHLFVSEDINAYSLPGNHIIINTALIKNCDSVSQLCGVIAHEIAHLELHHVTRKLISEVGLNVLVAVASNGNTQTVSSIIKALSSTAYERKLENEADAVAVNYLENANINPKGLADFLSRLNDIKTEVPANLEWLSTHPDSKKRVKNILGTIRSKTEAYTSPIGQEHWQMLKKACSDENE